MATVDYTGRRFGKLVAVEPSGGRDYENRIIWKLKCDCGEVVERVPSRLYKVACPACENCLNEKRRAALKRSRRAVQQAETLCWRCDNAYGGCAWSRSFEPVKGWEAIPHVLKMHGPRGEGAESFLVISCPQFKLDERYGGI